MSKKVIVHSIKFQKFISSELFAITAFLVGISIFFGMYEPKFLNVTNWYNIFRSSCYLILVASGQMVALIIGGFDLSVGSVMALTSFTTATIMVKIYNSLPNLVVLSLAGGMITGILSGMAVGFVNGLCIAILNVSPFIVTLGTMSLVSGIALYATTGIPIYGMPNIFNRILSTERLFMLPALFYLTAGIIALIWVFLRLTKTGRYFYAIGGNIHAAHVSGISVKYIIIIAYTLCSLMASLSGIFLTARLNSGEATMGAPFMLNSIAAAVLGGVRIGGGVGHIEWVVIGALIITVLSNGMNLMRIESKIQTIFVGLLLIGAVALERLRRRGIYGGTDHQ